MKNHHRQTSQDWTYSVNQYARLAKLNANNPHEIIQKIMQMHRDRFKSQAKIFDQIDKELNQ